VIAHTAMVGTVVREVANRGPNVSARLASAKGIGPMKIPDSLDELPTNGTRGRVYGEPYKTADGGTIITVAKVRAGNSTPVGVFVIHGSNVKWVAAVDENRIALIGVITGLIAAVLACVALVRRPPWPDLSATSHAWLRP